MRSGSRCRDSKSSAGTPTSACELDCLQYDTSSDLPNQCKKYQFPKLAPNGWTDQSDAANCPTIDWQTPATGVRNSIYSGGTLYYCGDSGAGAGLDPTDTGPCTTIKTAPITAPCNGNWSQLYNVNEGVSYASDWNSSCQNMAQTMVLEGKYKSVACFNMEAGIFGLEWGEYAQAWPSVGYNVSAEEYANNLACQLDPANTITECQELGNLCDTQLFTGKAADNNDSNEIRMEGGEFALETIQAIVYAIGEGLGG